jgi:hypothetical protein
MTSNLLGARDYGSDLRLRVAVADFIIHAEEARKVLAGVQILTPGAIRQTSPLTLREGVSSVELNL